MLVRLDYPQTFNNLIENILTQDFAPRHSHPAIDIAEYENESIVVAELPGVKKDELRITFENDVLTVAGERKPYEMPRDGRVLLNEMRLREFSRSIEFPHAVDGDKISADLQNGILKIVVPKAESARPRTIEVK